MTEPTPPPDDLLTVLDELRAGLISIDEYRARRQLDQVDPPTRHEPEASAPEPHEAQADEPMQSRDRDAARTKGFGPTLRELARAWRRRWTDHNHRNGRTPT